MPQKSSSSTDKTRLAGGRADVVSTPSGCARTPCDLQPDCFQTNQVDKRIASKDGAERQLNLRIDRIKQCLLEVLLIFASRHPLTPVASDLTFCLW